MLNPKKAIQLMPFNEVFHRSTCEENNLNIVPPDDMYKIFLLGEISAKLKDRPGRNESSLLAQAREILNVQKRDLTAKDVIEILPEAIITKGQQKTGFQKLKGTVSFVGVLSLISSVGMFVSLQPVLKITVKTVRLDKLWNLLRNKFHWMDTVLPTILDAILYTSSDLALIYSMQQSRPAVRSQMGVLSAGITMTTFFTRTLRREILSADLDYRYRCNLSLVSCAWLWSFLTPMALCTKSKVLGFFSVGSLFGALGFVVLPYPYGWATGFLGENTMDRCTIVSLIILFLGLASKSGKFIPNGEANEIFEVGAAVFGMLSFGISGLLKSCDTLYLGSNGKRWWKAMSTIYPALWISLACLGSITSYSSLTNTSITFVVLWMSQCLIYLTGLTTVYIFTSSCALFGITLWLKQHPEFLMSLFQI